MKKALIIIGSVIIVSCILITGIVAWQWQNISNQFNSAFNKAVTQTTAPTSAVNDANNNDYNDSTSSSTDVCGVLTLDIAKQILGKEATLSSQNAGNCTYSAMTSDGGFGVLVMVISTNDSASARTSFETAKRTVYENDTVDVSGLNVDGAYYANSIGQLSILKGNSWVIISGTSDKYANGKDLAVATAKLIYK